jgi:hypothetical protein
MRRKGLFLFSSKVSFLLTVLEISVYAIGIVVLGLWWHRVS